MSYFALTLSATSLPRSFDLGDPAAPRPVAMSSVQWIEQDIYGSCAGYVRQEDKSISATAAKAHGITDRMARSRGLPERTILSWITNSLRTATHVVGWSLAFDLDVIRAALVRHGGNPDALIRPGLVKIDLQAICAPIVGEQDEAGQDVPPSIGAAIKALAIEPNGLQSGLIFDALACREIFTRLCSEGLVSEMQTEQAA